MNKNNDNAYTQCELCRVMIPTSEDAVLCKKCKDIIGG